MRPARLGLILLVALAGCDDTIYYAAANKEMTWDVGASPEVVVELRDGGIHVRPGPPGAIKAVVNLSRRSKESQRVADEAVANAPGVSVVRNGDTIEIAEKEGKEYVGCSLELFVPPGTRLDLRTDRGDVWVGSNPRDGRPEPVALARVKIRTEMFSGVNSTDDPAAGLELDVEGIDLKLVRNGEPVDTKPLIVEDLPEGRHRWRSKPK